MRILHIWDMAGVGSLHSKHQRKVGHRSRIIHRLSRDPSGQTKQNGGIMVNGSPLYFTIRVLLKLFLMRPHIIHIHGWFNGLNYINKGKKLFFLKSKIIFHAHGSEVRDYEKQRGKPFSTSIYPSVNKWITSTQDIVLEEKMICIPNPVDVDFDKSIVGPRVPKTGLFISKYPIDETAKAKSYANANGIDLEFYDGMIIPPFSYKQFLEKLCTIEFYFDMKGSTNIKTNQISKAGLEAIALGCKVIDDQEQISSEMGSDSIEIYEQVINIYEELLK